MKEALGKGNEYFIELTNRYIQICVVRKRSLSITSSSSDDVSAIQAPKHRKKNRSRKMDEVERLAEMERQRRQKEAEQKVCYLFFVLLSRTLRIFYSVRYSRRVVVPPS